MTYSPPSSTLYIHSVQDLPPANLGVITLPQNRIVQIEGILMIPGIQILVPETTVLQGRDPDLDGIIGDIDGALVSTTGNGLVVKNIFLRNSNVGPSAFCLRSTTSAISPRVTRVQDVSVGGSSGILLEDVQNALINVLLDRSDDRGIVIRGANTGIAISQHTRLSSSAMQTGILFDAGSSTQLMRLNASQYIMTAPGFIGIRKDPLATLSGVGFFSNAFFDLFGGTALSGFNADSQVDVLFFSNFGIADSKTGGNIGINGNPLLVTTVIDVAGQFVSIGNGNPATHPLWVIDPASARISLSQPAGAASGVLVLSSVEPVNATVFASLSVRAVGGVVKGISARIVKNLGLPSQVILSPAFSGQTSGIPADAAGALSFQVSTMMLPGDYLQLQIANTTDAVDLIVVSANIGIVTTTT